MPRLGPRIKTVNRQVRLLKNPEPRFVSIVDHGANQTPFSTLKRVKPVTSKEKPPMAKQRKRIRPRKASKGEKVAKRQSEHAIKEVLFSGEEFEKKSDVKSWLTKNEWSDHYKITAKGDDFIVSDPNLDDEDFSKGEDREIKVEDGVTAKMAVPLYDADETSEDDEGEDDADEARSSKGLNDDIDGLESDDDDEDEEDTEQKLDSDTSKKFDYWGAYLSGGDTVSDVLKDAMSDGTPPGFDEVLFAMSKAMGNALKDNSKDLKTKLVDAGEAAAEVIYNVHEAFSAILNDDEATDEAKSHAKGWTESVEKALLIADEDKDDTSEDDEETEEDTASLQTSASDEAFGELKSMLKGIGDRLSEVEGSVKDASDTADSTAKRVEKLSKRAPKAKATEADGDVLSVSGEDDGYDEEEGVFEDYAFKNVLGLGVSDKAPKLRH